jgi:hypothetical protein
MPRTEAGSMTFSHSMGSRESRLNRFIHGSVNAFMGRAKKIPGGMFYAALSRKI